jgi:hypothetical protein
MPLEKKGFMTGAKTTSVLIAAVSSSMSHLKENLVKELKNSGYEVMQIKDIEEVDRIPELLEKYDVAIHMLSDQDDVRLTDNKGMEEHQVLLSVQHYLSQKLLSDNQEDFFKIYAWHPKSGIESIFEEENLARHLIKIQQMEEVEFLRTNFEDFKYYLLKNLEKEESEIEIDHHYIKGDNNPSIYFLYDSIDQSSALQYQEYLKKRGYAVLSPKFDGDILNIRQIHNSNLKIFDLAIIFADKVSINWVNMKIMDLMKSPGLGREKEILGKGLMMSEAKAKMCPLASRGFDIIILDGESMESKIDVFLSKNLL